MRCAVLPLSKTPNPKIAEERVRRGWAESVEAALVELTPEQQRNRAETIERVAQQTAAQLHVKSLPRSPRRAPARQG